MPERRHVFLGGAVLPLAFGGIGGAAVWYQQRQQPPAPQGAPPQQPPQQGKPRQ